MRGFVEYAPGQFARVGETRVVNGVTWTFSGKVWWSHDPRPYGQKPAELRSRTTDGDTVRRTRSLPSWTLPMS